MYPKGLRGDTAQKIRARRGFWLPPNGIYYVRSGLRAFGLKTPTGVCSYWGSNPVPFSWETKRLGLCLILCLNIHALHTYVAVYVIL